MGRIKNLAVNPPPITPDDVLEAALDLSEANGFFLLHPRAFSWLSRGLLVAIAALLNVCEKVGAWPETIMYLMLRFLP